MRWVKPSGMTSGDRALVRVMARRVAIQLAASCAVLVVLVAAGVFVLTHFHAHHGHEPRGDDDFVFEAVLIAGAAGIVLAAGIGWLAASRSVRPLSDALALQRRFVVDAGHELRTPLTILHTRAQMLDREIDAADPAKSLIGQLLRDSRVLGDIVDELLASAELAEEASRTDNVDLAALVADVSASMAVLFERAQVHLVTDADPGVDAPGSRASLRRALLALADNALSHTPTGGTVEIHAKRDPDGQIRLVVLDNGAGADEADLPRLTERFARGADTGRRPDSAGDAGTRRRFGLGLAIVNDIAHAHGGRLVIGGRPGGGFVASIVLPSTSPSPKPARNRTTSR